MEDVRTNSPLFTKQMYHNLGIHWASSIPAFLALACTPAPFIFYKYGKDIRLKCRYAAQAYEYGQIQRNAQKSVETAEGESESKSKTLVVTSP